MNMVSCDEFPPASVEEGGNWYGNIPVAPALLCAPVWQQNTQGNCNQLLRNVQTNVQYAIDPDADAKWVAWTNNDAWFEANAWNSVIDYPYPIPQAVGITDAQWGVNEQGGWSQKRSFTYGIADPADADDWEDWGSTSGSWTFASTAGTSTDATKVVCAINLWDQPNVYALVNPGYNAFCYSGQNTGFYKNVASYPAMNRCLITYGAAIATRDLLDDDERNYGKYGILFGRIITNITMYEDDDDLTDPIVVPDTEVDNKSPNPFDILGKK